MAKITVNGINMYYEVHGSGEPVVFFGGFAVDHTAWGLVLDKFKEHYQVLVFDNRGAGQTDVPQGPYSIEQMAKDVEALCSELDIHQAHFIGNSMGGVILQNLACRNPGLVKTAVISNSTSTLNHPFHVYLAAQLEFLKAGVPLDALIKASCSWLYSYQFLSKPGVLDQLVELALGNPFPFTLTGYEGQYAALSQADSRSWVDKIKTPTLVLAGDQDIVFSEESVRQLAEQIPNADYFCFSECGHLPMVEYPDKFSEIVLDYIKGTS